MPEPLLIVLLVLATAALTAATTLAVSRRHTRLPVPGSAVGVTSPGVV